MASITTTSEPYQPSGETDIPTAVAYKPASTLEIDRENLDNGIVRVIDDLFGDGERRAYARSEISDPQQLVGISDAVFRRMAGTSLLTNIYRTGENELASHHDSVISRETYLSDKAHYEEARSVQAARSVNDRHMTEGSLHRRHVDAALAEDVGLLTWMVDDLWSHF